MSHLEDARDALTGLALLQARIRAARVPRARPDNLRLATWNIRELGKAPRLDESIRLLAAVLRAFDLVSVVELRDDLTDLRRILHALGGRWDAVFSDYLLDAGGNRERVAFLFDRARVTFTGLASTADGPRRRVGDRYVRTIPWWRPPFLASFRAGRFDFVFLAAHVRWGASAPARRAELGAVVEWIAERSSETYFGDTDVLVAGDFNVAAASPEGIRTITSRGLLVPPGIDAAITTDLARHNRYDHILCLPRDGARFTGRAGAVDFYAGSFQPLLPRHRMTKAAFTYQISDHLPLWAEVDTD